MIIIRTNKRQRAFECHRTVRIGEARPPRVFPDGTLRYPPVTPICTIYSIHRRVMLKSCSPFCDSIPTFL